MIIKKTKFKDLFIVKQRNNKDKRGNLRETFNNKILKKNFVFNYCTTSKKNVLKGKILDVVIDLRRSSKTFGKSFKIVLSKENALGLFIPKGFAHAYLSLEKENIIYYQLDNYYNPKFESGIIYNDPIVKIKWPKGKFIVSKKDKKLLTFKKFQLKFKSL